MTKLTQMSSLSLSLSLALLAFFPACASVRSGGPDAATAASNLARSQGCVRATVSSRCYGEAEIVRMADLRERGESLASVAKEVGGTRAEIRALERQVREEQRTARRGKVARPADSSMALAAGQ